VKRDKNVRMLQYFDDYRDVPKDELE